MRRGTASFPLNGRDDDGDTGSANLIRIAGRLIVGAVVVFLLIWPTTNTGEVGDGSLQRPTSPEKASLHRAVDPRGRTRKFPARIQTLLAQSQIVGNGLREVKEGKKTVEEIFHNGNQLAGIGHDGASNGVHAGGIGSSGYIGAGSVSRHLKSAPMTLHEVMTFLKSFLSKLNSSNMKNKRATFHGIWAAYHELIVKWLYPWDQEYLTRMPPRREDGSVYLSVVSFRDESCPDTLKKAFTKAKNAQKLFVGLVQQNCEENDKCAKADPDCYLLFCSSEVGKKYCDNGNIRLLKMKDSEAPLGPYMMRYFASKLWQGEEWYMQIDSHMSFLQDWDALLIQMLKNAPSQKPVISHFPPPQDADLATVAPSRLCGPVFATSDLEGQIIRFEGSSEYDRVNLETPRFAPFIVAGYLVADSGMLRDVPFDPFLPYIFMGEEILLSARLWTSGYDIFSPTQNVVGHLYVRNNKPKFWDSFHRVFTAGVHNSLQLLVLNRIKHQLGYPEAAQDMVKPKSLFTGMFLCTFVSSSQRFFT
jgi:[Skp1-protein]-hydroxyproline N-acetylglucosaminyltransferase